MAEQLTIGARRRLIAHDRLGARWRRGLRRTGRAWRRIWAVFRRETGGGSNTTLALWGIHQTPHQPASSSSTDDSRKHAVQCEERTVSFEHDVDHERTWATRRAVRQVQQLHALDVASITPLRPPAVLNQPVRLYGTIHVRFGTVAHNEDAVVQRSATRGIKHSTRVQLELALVRLDGHADRLVCHRLQKTEEHSQSKPYPDV